MLAQALAFEHLLPRLLPVPLRPPGGQDGGHTEQRQQGERRGDPEQSTTTIVRRIAMPSAHTIVVDAYAKERTFLRRRSNLTAMSGRSCSSIVGTRPLISKSSV